MKNLETETKLTVHTVTYKNKTYYKVQDLTERRNSHVRTYKVDSQLNVLTIKEANEVGSKLHYAYKSATYVEEEVLRHIVAKRIVENNDDPDSAEKWDIQSACWIRDVLGIFVHVTMITKESQRSKHTLNINVKKAIRARAHNIKR